jgi:hypothetical protein
MIEKDFLGELVHRRFVVGCSLVAEAIGQAMVWGAPNEGVALAGALVTGFGCALEKAPVALPDWPAAHASAVHSTKTAR